jgi:very-short-patch-repair endonuclease
MLQPSTSGVWDLAVRQHGVVTRAQLLGLGVSSKAITHRVARGRLHRVRQGVYAVGRPELSRYGSLMAAVLSCGPDSALNYDTAAGLWRIRPESRNLIEVSIPAHASRRRPGIRAHRRALTEEDVTQCHRIPVTTPVRTLVDLATRLPRLQLEAAINEADKLDLVDPEALREALEPLAGQPGVPALRKTLDRRTFTMTDTELERRFLPIARKAGLSKPETQAWVNGFRVDFYWPDLGLVVETDGLRYHRTPSQQTKDRVRDQTHTASGLTPLRFTHWQVRYDPGHVERTLRAAARRGSRRL